MLNFHILQSISCVRSLYWWPLPSLEWLISGRGGISQSTTHLVGFLSFFLSLCISLSFIRMFLFVFLFFFIFFYIFLIDPLLSLALTISALPPSLSQNTNTATSETHIDGAWKTSWWYVSGNKPWFYLFESWWIPCSEDSKRQSAIYGMLW